MDNKIVSMFEDSDCAICFDPLNFKDRHTVCNRCHQKFHYACVRMWHFHDPVCPYCQSVPVEDSACVSLLRFMASPFVYVYHGLSNMMHR